ncbi:hypothetical protein V5O48_010356 [Marasmius crinis-equi]|uniref:Uncharacterized protein n=1 Tax=Marasmius crinis-equi TaxID=585013 RepID=A0ABR3F8J5_9AGAR
MLWKDAIMDNLSRWDASQQELLRTSEPSDIFGIEWNHGLDGRAGEDPPADVARIRDLLRHARVCSCSLAEIWTWYRLPFSIRQVGLCSSSESETACSSHDVSPLSGELIHDIDEWVMQNENYLRLLSRKAALQPEPFRSWSFGLVSLSQLPSVLSEPNVLSASRLKIQRPFSAPGFVVLEEKRKDSILVQPSQSSFDRSWSNMTGNVLRGMNWSNVFVAGGSVLGAYLTPDVKEEGAHKPEEWISSDIDMYIWGLSVTEANKKIEHVAQVYRSNLPTGSPFLAVRNSQTITLYSSWPTKRVQIVLKLVNNPREVLMNFDLDPCAIGYDGSTVWMLPRFVRALESEWYFERRLKASSETLRAGYTTFSMDIIHGHYLSNRKASRDSRIFKYANKGFGIRILPSYLTALEAHPSRLSLDDLQFWAREWTCSFIELRNCLQHLEKSSVGSPLYPSDRLPTISHAALDHKFENNNSGARLSGFTVLMRHVALWEEEARDSVRIEKDTRSRIGGHDEFENTQYDDTPHYIWNESFSIPAFQKTIHTFNDNLTEKAEKTANRIFWDRNDRDTGLEVCRLSCGTSITDLLSEDSDLHVPVILPRDVADFINGMVVEVLRERGLQTAVPPLRIIYNGEIGSGWRLSQETCLAVWTLNMELMNWQLVDRRMDEIRELLWDFHRRFAAGQWIPSTCDIQRRGTEKAELDAFVDWVSRRP